MLINEQSYKLPTPTVNSRGCLGKTASELVDQLTPSVVVVEGKEIYGETTLWKNNRCR